MQITVHEGYTDEGIVARFCSPIGQYPRGVVGTRRAGYLFDPEAVITVVKVSNFSVPDDYYSEMEWAHPEEIRFFSSISLARENGKDAIIVYPLSLRYLVEVSPFTSLDDEDTLQLIKTSMVENARKNRRKNRSFRREAPYPPFISKVRYEDCGQAFVRERQALLFDAINPTDFLLIRGLSTWLRSAMLAQHQFMEEAVTTLFISLEASFRLVLRRLRESGQLNPGLKEAGELIGSVFNASPSERYFSEYYDDRVKTFHPESRFGIFPQAPLMVDDYYFLHEDLRKLYAYLLIGFVDSEYQNSI